MQENLGDWKATTIDLCGTLLMFDSDLNLQKVTNLKDTYQRKIFMQQLPNILEEYTWDTPGINQTLVGETFTYLDNEG